MSLPSSYNISFCSNQLIFDKSHFLECFSGVDYVSSKCCTVHFICISASCLGCFKSAIMQNSPECKRSTYYIFCCTNLKDKGMLLFSVTEDNFEILPWLCEHHLSSFLFSDKSVLH